MKKYIALGLLLTLTGCSELEREISPTGQTYDEMYPPEKPYVDTRTPEQIAKDKESARKLVEEDDKNWKKYQLANPVNVPAK